MTQEEKEKSMMFAYKYVQRSSVTKWTSGFLKDLKYSYQPVEISYYLGLNLGMEHDHKQINRLMKSKNQKLPIETVINNFMKRNKCVILINIEALPHLKFSNQSIPTNEVIEQLHGLLIDNRNTVIIMGNTTIDQLEKWFGRKIVNNQNNFWLVAESGYLYKTGMS
jgi:hypothetical protein